MRQFFCFGWLFPANCSSPFFGILLYERTDNVRLDEAHLERAAGAVGPVCRVERCLHWPAWAKDNSKLDKQLLPPVLSHDSGFYEQVFTLALTHPGSDTTIYYTPGGPDPDAQWLDGGQFTYKSNYSYPVSDSHPEYVPYISY